MSPYARSQGLLDAVPRMRVSRNQREGPLKQEMQVFYPLLEYELNASERYRRFVSLVMVSSKTDLPTVKAVTNDTVRKTDVLAHFDSAVVILMGETQKADALRAVDRIRKLFPEETNLQFSVSTYPDDEVKPEALIRLAYDRLNKARQSAETAVVAED